MVVVIVLAVVLVGGLAAVAVTSGELAGSGAVRTKAVTAACAEAAVERIRGMLPNVDITQVTGTMSVGSSSLNYGPDVVGSDEVALTALSPDQYDGSANYEGENITNKLVSGVIGSGANTAGIRMYRLTAVCSGPSYGRREVEVVMRYGVADPGQ
jgi:hypothetical protein